MKLVRTVLAIAVLAGAAVVLAGVGQGSAPRQETQSAAAAKSSIARVGRGSHGVQEGRRLFSSEGCDTCHTVAAAKSTGTLGPRLDVTLQGTPRKVIQGYIRDPKTVMLPGYDNHLMPRDYTERLSAGDIRALSSFLATAAGK